MRIVRYIIIFSFFIITGGYFVMAEKNNITSLKWKERLLLIHVINDNYLEQYANDFYHNHLCDFKNRHLKLLIFHHNQNNIYHIPDYMKDKQGIWLVGYDGFIAGHSADTSYFKQLFYDIDAMPIRQSEMQQQSSSC